MNMGLNLTMIYRNTKLTRILRQLPCQHCGIISETVCAAHRNEGKGMGIKVSDALCAALCYECHYTLDMGKELTKVKPNGLRRINKKKLFIFYV